MDMLSKTELIKIKENIRYFSWENVLNSLKITPRKRTWEFCMEGNNTNIAFSTFKSHLVKVSLC